MNMNPGVMARYLQRPAWMYTPLTSICVKVRLSAASSFHLGNLISLAPVAGIHITVRLHQPPQPYFPVIDPFALSDFEPLPLYSGI
jgi:hypothetical protein